MNNSHLMSMGERFSDLNDNRKDLSDRVMPLGHRTGKRRPFDIFHHDAIGVGTLDRFDHTNNIGMVEFLYESRFPEELPNDFRIFRPGGGEDFDGDMIFLFIFRFVDRAHCSAPERGMDAVSGNGKDRFEEPHERSPLCFRQGSGSDEVIGEGKSARTACEGGIHFGFLDPAPLYRRVGKDTVKSGQWLHVGESIPIFRDFFKVSRGGDFFFGKPTKGVPEA